MADGRSKTEVHRADHDLEITGEKLRRCGRDRAQLRGDQGALRWQSAYRREDES